MFAVVLTAMLSIELGSSEAVAKGKVWRLKIQSYTVPGKLDCQWVVPKKFTELVRKHIKGRVDMSFHHGGEMVGPREIWTAISSGTIDGGTKQP